MFMATPLTTAKTWKPNDHPNDYPKMNGSMKCEPRKHQAVKDTKDHILCDSIYVRERERLMVAWGRGRKIQ